MKTKSLYGVFVILLATATLFVSGSSANPTMHWIGLGNSQMGGFYETPPVSGVGYGLKGYHGEWSCELAFDSVMDLPGYADGSDLITFCLEWTEELIGENDFYGVVNTGAVGGSEPLGFDPLDTESAWLYDQYLLGNDFGITDVNRRAAVVQEAIWSFEGEFSWAHDYSETDGLKLMAQGAVIAGWVNTDIRVLNVYWQSDDTPGQDVLIKIPEPATIAMLSLGSLLLVRKKRQ
ncbi:MAG: PEP-CTERM sorting domain-containing protein [Anaerohalosphaeraceae bacterium]|nr:PEP-CTERM sorting domain-containing protein [Anaerohalosphaeraceae bacterium]